MCWDPEKVGYEKDENVMKTIRSSKKKVICRVRRNNSATSIAQFYDFLTLRKKNMLFRES